MSIEHMRAAKTLPRNLQMAFRVAAGEPISTVAKDWGVKPSSVRSSVVRTTTHLTRFIGKHPDTLSGDDPRKEAFRAFAQHVGVRVRYGRPRVPQLDLF
jgi:hypothetical protein